MRSSRWMSALLIFILVVLWGVSFAIYKVALRDAPPLLFAGIRTFLGGLIVLCIAIAQGRKAYFVQYFWVYFTSAILNVVLFFGLQTIGLDKLPAGLFSVLIYLEPVLVGVLAWLWLGETMTWQKITGLICGFSGVAAISVHSLTSHLSAVGVVIGIITAIFWAIGTIYSKKAQEKIDTMWLLAIQFLIGGVMLTGFGTITESFSSIHWTASFIWATLFAGFLGIAVSWMIWFRLVATGEATRVAAFTFFVPLISVLTSVLFLHEPLSVWLLVGLVLIVGGIYLTNLRTSRNP